MDNIIQIESDSLFTCLYQKVLIYGEQHDISEQECLYIYTSLFESFHRVDHLEKVVIADRIMNSDCIDYLVKEFTPGLSPEDKQMADTLYELCTTINEDFDGTLNDYNCFMQVFDDVSNEYQDLLRKIIALVKDNYDPSIIDELNFYIGFDDQDKLIAFTPEGALLMLDYIHAMHDLQGLGSYDPESLFYYFYNLEAAAFNQCCACYSNPNKRAAWLSDYARKELPHIQSDGKVITPKDHRVVGKVIPFTRKR